MKSLRRFIMFLAAVLVAALPALATDYHITITTSGGHITYGGDGTTGTILVYPHDKVIWTCNECSLLLIHFNSKKPCGSADLVGTTTVTCTVGSSSALVVPYLYTTFARNAENNNVLVADPFVIVDNQSNHGHKKQ